MDDKKIQLSEIIRKAIITAIITLVITFIVVFALSLIVPFLLCGPKDPFWDQLANGHVQAEGALTKVYLNLLQWLAGIR